MPSYFDPQIKDGVERDLGWKVHLTFSRDRTLATTTAVCEYAEGFGLSESKGRFKSSGDGGQDGSLSR